MEAEKKRVQVYVLAKARNAGVPIPTGEIPGEEPDFRFETELRTLGIELSEVLRPASSNHGILPVEEESFHDELMQMAQEEYFSVPEAKPVHVSVYFANARGKKRNKQQMAGALLEFVRANVNLRGAWMKVNGQLLGAAGVHFVAARLNALGLHAAATIRNVPGVDLLVSAQDGHKSVAIQVKTAAWASRTSGRGTKKTITRCEWACNYIENSAPNLFYAFVDLRNFDELPDVYLIPSKWVAQHYTSAPTKKENWKWPRFHVSVHAIRRYKNNFRPICKAFGITATPA